SSIRPSWRSLLNSDDHALHVRVVTLSERDSASICCAPIQRLRVPMADCPQPLHSVSHAIGRDAVATRRLDKWSFVTVIIVASLKVSTIGKSFQKRHVDGFFNESDVKMIIVIWPMLEVNTVYKQRCNLFRDNGVSDKASRLSQHVTQQHTIDKRQM